MQQPSTTAAASSSSSRGKTAGRGLRGISKEAVLQFGNLEERMKRFEKNFHIKQGKRVGYITYTQIDR